MTTTERHDFSIELSFHNRSGPDDFAAIFPPNPTRYIIMQDHDSISGKKGTRLSTRQFL